ncbi:hypothetical protein MINTM019_28680 [Mycobacterium paraintracellulare]|nr:hypothetical protein MINTM019_28680 [Mycobacterium paraintracellulare]
MISHVVDDAAYDAELTAVVQALADGPAQSYPWMKRALSAAAPTSLPTVQSIELEGQSQLTRTPSSAGGPKRFANAGRGLNEPIDAASACRRSCSTLGGATR